MDCPDRENTTTNQSNILFNSVLGNIIHKHTGRKHRISFACLLDCRFFLRIFSQFLFRLFSKFSQSKAVSYSSVCVCICCLYALLAAGFFPFWPHFARFLLRNICRFAFIYKNTTSARGKHPYTLLCSTLCVSYQRN